MTPIASPTPIDLYPSGDGQPLAETFDHLYAILMTIELLRTIHIKNDPPIKSLKWRSLSGADSVASPFGDRERHWTHRIHGGGVRLRSPTRSMTSRKIWNGSIISRSSLRLYLHGQQATVLGNQYLYYSQGYPKLRIAPDVMVIFDVAPGGRDNYKIWEEGAIPRVAFDVSTPLNIKITSPSTRNQDEGFKKDLYEQMGIQEYWQFDPKAQWISGQLALVN
jgi:Putative restriction endonuclease